MVPPLNQILRIEDSSFHYKVWRDAIPGPEGRGESPASEAIQASTASRDGLRYRYLIMKEEAVDPLLWALLPKLQADPRADP